MVAIYTKLAYQGSAAAGTGIVTTPPASCLTNNHVIKGATTLRVKNVGNGRTYSARVLGYSVASDVALLQADGTPRASPTARIGAAPKLGAAVTAYGNGGGNGVDADGAAGNVRAVGRSITARATARAAASA